MFASINFFNGNYCTSCTVGCVTYSTFINKNKMHLGCQKNKKQAMPMAFCHFKYLKLLCQAFVDTRIQWQPVMMMVIAFIFVFRVNGAIIKGFENDVGTKTSFYGFTINSLKNSLSAYEEDGFDKVPHHPVNTESTTYLFAASNEYKDLRQ